MGLLPITDVALYWVKTDCPIPSSVEGFTVIGQSVSNKYFFFFFLFFILFFILFYYYYYFFPSYF